MGRFRKGDEMSKFASFAEYPPRSLAGAEAALLTAWASLERFHDQLVLVGGLAVKYLTTPGTGLLPGAVTMDVDLGVTLAADGGQYGSLADDLTALRLSTPAGRTSTTARQSMEQY